MYRDVRTKSISIGAENEDLPTISNLLKGVTDFISTNNFKIDLKKKKNSALYPIILREDFLIWHTTGKKRDDQKAESRENVFL